MNKPQPRPVTLLVWSLAWALAMIASALVFKGQVIGDWVESFLSIGGLTFVFCRWPGRCGRAQ